MITTTLTLTILLAMEPTSPTIEHSQITVTLWRSRNSTTQATGVILVFGVASACCEQTTAHSIQWEVSQESLTGLQTRLLQMTTF